jgi:anti-sigma regulatory factor (Ser/Thr protein kinase)
MSTLDASFDLPPLAASVPTARHVVVELLRSWQVPHDLDDAALLVTELVSNVIDHVGGEATLTVELTSSEDWLRIAVVDGSAIRPVVQELSHDRPRGRGLRMLQIIASRWGSDAHGDGKRVWFELWPQGE